jgi:hypothetical protein
VYTSYGRVISPTPPFRGAITQFICLFFVLLVNKFLKSLPMHEAVEKL